MLPRILTRKHLIKGISERALDRCQVASAGLERQPNDGMVQRGQCVRRAPAPHLTRIFAQGHIAPIMQTMFDAPRGADDGQPPRR